MHLEGRGTGATAAGSPPALARFVGKGTDAISFAPAGRHPGSKPIDSPVVWNADRTEASVQLSTYHGPLAASGHDIKLRKVGADWVVVSVEQAWVS